MSNTTASRIKAACTCGKKYVVRAEVAGKKVRCNCGEVFSVPTTEEVQQATPEKMCPWCDAWITEDQEECEKCETEGAKQAERVEQLESKESDSGFWRSNEVVFASAICLPMVFGVSLYQIQLKGPDFLTLYFGVGVACLLGCLVVRYAKFCVAVAIVFLLSFEAIGAIRYGYGVSQGMRQFDQLFNYMIFGPLAFVGALFGEGSGGSGGSSWGGGSSCGGGCGGGGCGGCGG